MSSDSERNIYFPPSPTRLASSLTTSYHRRHGVAVAHVTRSNTLDRNEVGSDIAIEVLTGSLVLSKRTASLHGARRSPSRRWPIPADLEARPRAVQLAEYQAHEGAGLTDHSGLSNGAARSEEHTSELQSLRHL